MSNARCSNLGHIVAGSPLRRYRSHQMQRAEKVGVDDGMRSIVVRKRAGSEDWLTPKPIPSDLARVDAFALDLLPDQLAPWIDDIASRLQCPPDYPAITAMTALGAILGRKIGIKPQMKTDWIEIPNVWGAFIGPPGMLKSPAMNEALRPIHRLEADAVRNNEIAQQAYAAGLDAFRLRKVDGKLYAIGGRVGSCYSGGWSSNVWMNEAYDMPPTLGRRCQQRAREPASPFSTEKFTFWAAKVGSTISAACSERTKSTIRRPIAGRERPA